MVLLLSGLTIVLLCEAAQIERSARISNCWEPLGIHAAGGKAIDKRLEHSMHVVTARFTALIARSVARSDDPYRPSIEIPGVTNSL